MNEQEKTPSNASRRAEEHRDEAHVDATAATGEAIDPFAVLGLPVRFDLTSADLRRAYLARAARCHPDRFPDVQARADAEVESARLNEAHRVLMDEERRADALLRRFGGPSAEAHKALPDGFLLEIFEIRQELEEAVATNDEAAQARLESWAAEERERHIDEIGQLFASLDPGSPDPALLIRIRTQMNAWRYIERMAEQLHPA